MSNCIFPENSRDRDNAESWLYVAGRDGKYRRALTTTYTYSTGPDGDYCASVQHPDGTRCDYDVQNQIYRLSDKDGNVSESHDRPIRYLAAQEDPKTDDAEADMNPKTDEEPTN